MINCQLLGEWRQQQQQAKPAAVQPPFSWATQTVEEAVALGCSVTVAVAVAAASAVQTRRSPLTDCQNHSFQRCEHCSTSWQTNGPGTYDLRTLNSGGRRAPTVCPSASSIACVSQTSKSIHFYYRAHSSYTLFIALTPALIHFVV